MSKKRYQCAAQFDEFYEKQIRAKQEQLQDAGITLTRAEVIEHMENENA